MLKNIKKKKIDTIHHEPYRLKIIINATLPNNIRYSYYLPVLPCPLMPRSLSLNSSTTLNSTLGKSTNTN